MDIEGRFSIIFDTGSVVFVAGIGIFIPDGPEHRHMGEALSPVVRVIFVEDI